MDELKKNRLREQACRIRMGAVEGTYRAKSGHPGGSLSAADLLAYLYFAELRVREDDPQWAGRDRFVLSKGHACPALYAALALRGYFPLEELQKLRQVGSMLQGHPDMKGTPGDDMSTGSLGQGISAACGMALGGKLSNQDFRVYTMLGDGELQEGQVWEAAMFAAHQKLDNLCAMVDANGLQIDGKVEEVCSVHPIGEKFEAFGWHVIHIDGHDFDQIEAAFAKAKTVKGKPSVLVARTVKGKGVSFMEDQCSWHGKGPNEQEYSAAMAELNKALAELGV